MSDRTGAIRAAFADVDISIPSNLFAYGFALGQAAEREAQEAADDELHRTAVRAIVRDVARADRRAHFDQLGIVR